MSRLTFLFMAGWLLALASPASAVTYAKFYDGGTGYSGPFNGAGTVYVNTSGSPTTCPDGHAGCGASDILDTSLGFLSGGITATVNVGNKVWDDLAPNFGGLGVGTGSPSNSDQIAGADVLTLTFPTQVILMGVGTLFASGHTPFSSDTSFDSVAKVAAASTTIMFSLSVDGGGASSVLFDLANKEGLSLQGTTFAFSELSGNPEFYVSALKYGVCGKDVSCETNIVPIPGALPLFATGLGALGLLGWRRKRKAAAA